MKMSEKSPIPQISMTNTKKEMLEAYEAVKSLIKTKEKELLDAEKTRKELEKKRRWLPPKLRPLRIRSSEYTG
jgi:hypothetical protein